MKKLSVLFLLFCFLAAPLCADAEESKADKKTKKQAEKAEKKKESEEKTDKEEKYEDPLKDAPKKQAAVQSRTFEIGLMNIDVFFSNNFYSAFDFFKKTLIIDLDEISSGLKLDAGINVKPFYFMIDSKKGWGFGLSTNIDTFGFLDLNGAMLSFDEADGAKSAAAGAAFVSAGIDTFFQIQKFKIKARPALYFTAAYVKTDLSYYFVNNANGTSVINIDYDMRIFTPVPMDNINPGALSGTPGFDFSFGFEYPLSKELGFSGSVLDFDIGFDFINVPLVSSTLKNYKRIEGSLGKGDPVNILDDMGGFVDSISVNEYTVTDGIELIEVRRPFRALMYINWRPTGRQSFTVTPVLGFALSDFYPEPFSIETGVNMRLSSSEIMVAELGINYIDRAWVNSVNFALNLRVFEINFGLKMRSHDFLRSFAGYGLGANLGLKFGY